MQLVTALRDVGLSIGENRIWFDIWGAIIVETLTMLNFALIAAISEFYVRRPTDCAVSILAAYAVVVAHRAAVSCSTDETQAEMFVDAFKPAHS